MSPKEGYCKGRRKNRRRLEVAHPHFERFPGCCEMDFINWEVVHLSMYNLKNGETAGQAS